MSWHTVTKSTGQTLAGRQLWQVPALLVSLFSLILQKSYSVLQRTPIVNILLFYMYTCRTVLQGLPCIKLQFQEQQWKIFNKIFVLALTDCLNTYWSSFSPSAIPAENVVLKHSIFFGNWQEEGMMFISSIYN